MSGEVTVLPGKRFVADDALLSLADLNDAGSPLMQLDENSIALNELIYQDVFDIISEGLVGVRKLYTFPTVTVAPNNGVNNEVVTVDMPEVRAGDPVQVTQVLALSAEFNGEALDGSVRVRVYSLDGVSIPAGTSITIIVFTPKRVLPSGLPGGPPDPAGTSGYLEVTPGYLWKDGDQITTGRLDKTCQPTAIVPPASVSRRELSAPDVQAIAAPLAGGAAFNGRVPTRLVIPPHNFVAFSTVVPDAAVGQVPVLGGGPIIWRAVVLTADHVTLVLQNVTNVTQTVAQNTPYKGVLL